MSRLDINHVGPDRAFRLCSALRAFILSQLGINHAGLDRALGAVRAFILN